MPGTGHLLDLDDYRTLIDLNTPFTATGPAEARSAETLTRSVLDTLSADPAVERLGLDAAAVHRLAGSGHGRETLRALLTVRDPRPLPADTACLIDELLAVEARQRPAVDVAALPSIADQPSSTRYPAAARTALWRGDITTLAADAIVNAANSGLLGCFRPGHRCIDNAIHDAAGPRLRQDCRTIITTQGAPEPTGTAKITRSYHLPSRYVLHTVGPIVNGPLQARHTADLEAAYRSCLTLAAAVEGIRTVAFCSISTGVFGYPAAPAARTALATVAAWLQEHPDRIDRVVFNVFTPADHDIYRRELTRWDLPQ